MTYKISAGFFICSKISLKLLQKCPVLFNKLAPKNSKDDYVLLKLLKVLKTN